MFFNLQSRLVHILNAIVYTVHHMNNKDKDDSLTLEILQVIENQNDVTQRHLADKLGVALGLANSYLKRCVLKGLVKVQQAPANRYLYYLTLKGFAEKSRLTADYLSTSFNFYRDASSSITQIYQQYEATCLKRILFCGVSELAEIASIRSHDYKFNIVGIFDPLTDKKNFLDLQVINDLKKAPVFDACLVTSLTDAQELFALLNKNIAPEIIYVPSILGINRN